MSAGSTKFTVSRIAALSLVSLWLAGCTNTNNPPAPVSSAGGAASSSTNSGMLITPPPSGVKSAPQAQPIQPMQTQTIQPQPAPVAQEPVQTVNGRIVYNRKYGDIPKGSYTGGSTYTVNAATRYSISPGSPATISATWRNATTSRPRTR